MHGPNRQSQNEVEGFAGSLPERHGELVLLVWPANFHHLQILFPQPPEKTVLLTAKEPISRLSFARVPRPIF